MKIAKYYLLIIFFIFLEVLTLVNHLDIRSSLLSLVNFIFFFTVPGALLLMCFKISKIGFIRYLLLSVGLSLSLILIEGLAFNTAWFYFTNTSSLTKNLLFYNFMVLTLVLTIIAVLRNRKKDIAIYLKLPSLTSLLLFSFPPILTIFSIFGAISLNNNGPNILTIAALCGITLTILTISIFHERVGDSFIAWSLYFVSLSLLLMMSLRSWFASGWDIQDELILFQFTKELGTWNPDNIKHAYNACLSITLLPTIISHLTSVSDEYIYKVIYQVLFAFVPLIVFYTLRSFSKSILCFLAVVYFISQPLFVQPTTALMRQEIAFIFLAFMMYVLFESHISRNTRNILFIVFSFGLVLSHYSTTYIALLLLIPTYFSLRVFRFTEKIGFIHKLYKKVGLSRAHTKYEYNLNPIILLSFLLFAIFWYSVINSQVNHLQSVLNDALSNLDNMFTSEIKSSETRKSIQFLASDFTTNEEIQDYTNEQLGLINEDRKRLYNPMLYSETNSVPLFPRTVEPIVSSEINRYLIISLEVLKQIFKILVIVGPIYLFFRYFGKTTFPREYLVFIILSVTIVTVMTFHPSIGQHYNLSRFYLQLLFYISLPAIVLANFLTSPLKEKSYPIIGFILTLLFIYLSGLSSQLIGGEARMYLNNFGIDYDKFYIHKEELASGEWLIREVGKDTTLFADDEAYLRIKRIENRSFNNNLLPNLIYTDAYIYASYSNTVNNRTSIHHDGNVLLFSFPQEFLEQNKNLIYSNGGSKIYR